MIENLTDDEQIRLFNGNGNWETFNAANKIPSIFMSDGPHGLRKQEISSYSDLNNSKISTCFPTASCIASSWNKNSLFKLGEAIGKEANSENVNIVLGPGINIKRSPLCGRNFEYFSEDPYLVGKLAANYIKGMESTGTGSCLKHFACNNQEKRRQTSNSIVDERTLHEIYLRAFEIAIKEANPIAIMNSYNRLNGEYTGSSKYLLTDVLRKKWNFNGIVISDWGACINAPKCLNAGMNLSMPDSNGYFGKSISKALADKVIDFSTLEQSNKILLSNINKLITGKKSSEKINYTNQHKIALDLACDSAVLLKNEDFLPLKTNKVIILGELAEFMKFQGGGSSHINCLSYPNAIQAFESQGFSVDYAKAYYSGFCKKDKIIKKNKPLEKTALELAEKSLKENIPILFFCGLTESYEGEGFDRDNLNLPDEQLNILNKVLQITKNIGIVNFSGSPVVFPFSDKVKSILQMYLCGQACGEAVVNLCTGKINPSGKLAETFPNKIEDIPCYRNFALETDNIEYREGIFTGYRYYETKNIPVAYEFGYGLSYTTFEYKNLSIFNNNSVSVDIKNSGKVDGSEIIQIYVENPANKDRAIKQLAGFEKVFIKSGEEKNVVIDLDSNIFKCYSTSSGNFETISGTYKIHAAASVKDIRLSKEIKIEGFEFEKIITPIEENFYESKRIPNSIKGNFTKTSSLSDMAKSSFIIKSFLKIIEMAIIVGSKGKSKEDPSVKIQLCAIKENPLESLISTSNGIISEKLVAWLVKRANS